MEELNPKKQVQMLIYKGCREVEGHGKEKGNPSCYVVMPAKVVCS